MDDKEQLEFELEQKIKDLKGFLRRYYEMLPNECFMSEQTQADKLLVSRGKIQSAKHKLISEGLLTLETVPNGKRLNPKHILHKTIPNILKKVGEKSSRFSPEDLEFYGDFFYPTEIRWKVLQRYTAVDLNSLNKLEKVQVYMDCGFIVIPTHYPIFTPEGVRCSCSKAFNCSNKGKHPKYRYKYINSFNYDSFKARYLAEFKKNPDLNIGFKVMGYSVLDIDYRSNGDKTLQRLLKESEINMNHVLSVRGGNGLHYYADNINLKNTAGIIGDGLDVRSECGFIVAAGSRHYSGKFYEWNEIGKVTTIPSQWIENSDDDETKIPIEKESQNNPKISKRLKDIILPKVLTPDYVIRNGERELTLFKWGCRKRGEGKNVQEIYGFLISIRDNHCEDGDEPVSDEEIKDIAGSAANYPTNSEKRLNSNKYNN